MFLFALGDRCSNQSWIAGRQIYLNSFLDRTVRHPEAQVLTQRLREPGQWRVKPRVVVTLDTDDAMFGGRFQFSPSVPPSLRLFPREAVKLVIGNAVGHNQRLKTCAGRPVPVLIESNVMAKLTLCLSPVLEVNTEIDSRKQPHIQQTNSNNHITCCARD